MFALLVLSSGICAGCTSGASLPAAPGAISPHTASLSEGSPDITQGNDGAKFTDVLSVSDTCEAGPGPAGLTTGPDHTVWYIDDCLNSVYKFDMKRAIVTTQLNGIPEWITEGPDSNMWVTIRNSAKIAKVTPRGSVTYFNQSCTNSQTSLNEIATGADGNLWFTTFGSSLPGTGIGKITPAGVATCFSTSRPFTAGIVAGPDGNIWFAEPQAPTMLGKITPAGVLTEYPDPEFCVGMITAGDGNLYCASLHGIVRIDTHTAAETVVTPFGETTSLATSGTGADAVLYYADGHTKLETLHLSNGNVTRDLIPSNQGHAVYVAYGPDKNLWYTAHGNQGSSFVSVDLFRILTAVPAALTLAAGQSQQVTASETHFTLQNFAGSSSNTAVATIVPAGQRGVFTVKGIAAGSAVLTIHDTTFNSVTIGVTVQ
ncbi:MAG TPA: hypothetical protein VKT51_08685 [Candidatus Eremiobacteraceae bacterium]|nr:hypothetical protein [Candidatus Eremiobacteraceae bacterium]